MVPRIKPPGYIREALSKLQHEGYHTAIVAGGAIRDMYHDVEVSDVDIFIEYKMTSNNPKRAFTAPEWNQYWRDVFFSGGTFYGIAQRYSAYNSDNLLEDEIEDSDQHILAIWDILTSEAVYQVIFLNVDPKQYVDQKFDFGLCKAWFDGKKLHYSRDFNRDSRNRTVTLVGDLNVDQIKYACEVHYPRIQEKYPGYKLSVGE